MAVSASILVRPALKRVLKFEKALTPALSRLRERGPIESLCDQLGNSKTRP